MGRDRNQNGTRSRANRAWLRSLGRPCWICRAMGLKGTIDYSLPATHPYSFEVDHLVPVSRGGDLYDRENIDATHRCCNQWRGNRSVGEVLEIARRRRGEAAAEGEGASGFEGTRQKKDPLGTLPSSGDGGRRVGSARPHIGPIETTRDWFA